MDTTPSRGPAAPFLVTKSGTANLTYEQARSSAFVMTSRGVRLQADAADLELARWLAACVPLRADTVLSHSTAARLLRLPLPRIVEELALVHVTTPRQASRPRRRDIRTHHAQLPSEDVRTLWDFRITTAARTYVDMASILGRRALVALGDVVMREHHVSRETLHEVASRRRRYPGRRLALRSLDWLDPGAESPRESHLRVLLREAALPPPEVNGVIRDGEGRFLARGDLVFRRERVIVEYDGEVHAPMAQRAKDAARRARLRENGWIVVEVVGEDMHSPERVIARVRGALRDGATWIP